MLVIIADVGIAIRAVLIFKIYKNKLKMMVEIHPKIIHKSIDVILKYKNKALHNVVKKNIVNIIFCLVFRCKI